MSEQELLDACGYNPEKYESIIAEKDKYIKQLEQTFNSSEPKIRRTLTE